MDFHRTFNDNIWHTDFSVYAGAVYLILGVGVCIVSKQLFSSLIVALSSCLVQRCHALLLYTVHLCLVCAQPIDC